MNERFRSILPVLTLLLSAEAFGDDWVTYTSDNFTLYSDLRESDAIEILQNFELFRLATLTLLGLPDEPEQELMAHTDPDMTRAYQKGHARKILRIDMMLPFHVPGRVDGVEEQRAVYCAIRRPEPQEIFPENSLTKNRIAV